MKETRKRPSGYLSQLAQPEPPGGRVLSVRRGAFRLGAERFAVPVIQEGVAVVNPPIQPRVPNSERLPIAARAEDEDRPPQVDVSAAFLPEVIDATPGYTHEKAIEAKTTSNRFVRPEQGSGRPPEAVAPVAADVAAKAAEPMRAESEPRRVHPDLERPIVAPGAVKAAPPANQDMPLGAAAQPIMETVGVRGSHGKGLRTPSVAEPPPGREKPPAREQLHNHAQETVAASSAESTKNAYREQRQANRSRVHIGTVEIRSVISPPVAPPAPPQRPAESQMARAAATEPLARGLAWSFGLVQG